MTKKTTKAVKAPTVKINWNALTDETIEPGIRMVAKSTDTDQLRIHKLLVATAAVWKGDSDQKKAVRRVNMMLEELADGIRKQAIVAWVTSPKLFGMLVKEVEVATKKTGVTKTVKVIAAGKKKAKALDMKFIANSHWWTFTKEPVWKAFDLTAKITTLLVEADKVVAKADKRQKALPREILDALRNVEKMTVKA